MSLVQLVYVSSARKLFSEEEMFALLAQSRANNAAHGITGMLLYSDGSLMQAIEGEREVVDTLTKRIADDPRHCSMMILLRQSIEERTFPTWSMDFARPDREDLLAVPGCNDFFIHGRSLADLPPSGAKTLLEAFRRMNP